MPGLILACCGPRGGKIGLRVLGCRYKIVEGVADADYGFDTLAARFGFGRFYLCYDESVFWGIASLVVKWVSICLYIICDFITTRFYWISIIS